MYGDPGRARISRLWVKRRGGIRTLIWRGRLGKLEAGSRCMSSLGCVERSGSLDQANINRAIRLTPFTHPCSHPVPHLYRQTLLVPWLSLRKDSTTLMALGKMTGTARVLFTLAGPWVSRTSDQTVIESVGLVNVPVL